MATPRACCTCGAARTRWSGWRPSGAGRPRPGELHLLSAADVASRTAAMASTHPLGPGECLALAEALDRLPPRLVAHAMEVAGAELGEGLSEAVRAALPELIGRVAAAVRQAHGPDRRQ
ncbi:hypothetical protein [Streptomyces collinus]|uniref:hypothetical protein n=1 Tax=Streptomyces collinus TaxID=42684 RepID=UPI0036F064D0